MSSILFDFFNISVQAPSIKYGALSVFNQNDMRGLGHSLKSMHANLRTVFRVGLERFVDIILMLDRFKDEPIVDGKKFPPSFDDDEYLFVPEEDENRWRVLSPAEREVPEDNLATWLSEERFNVGNIGDGEALKQAIHELVTYKASYKRARSVYEDLAVVAKNSVKTIKSLRGLLSQAKEVQNDLFLSALHFYST